MITGLYAGICALLLTGLYIRVVLARFKYRVSLGDGKNQDLNARIRIHGNFVETVPVMLLLLYLLETHAYSIYLLHTIGIAILLSRVCNFIGISKTENNGFTRRIAGVTTTTIFVISGLLLISDYVKIVIQ